MKEQNISACTELKNIIDGFGTVQTAWGLIVAVTLIIAFIFCVFAVSKRRKVSSVDIH